MKASLVKAIRDQRGFTLIEVLVASAIGVVVMGALTSVVLTSYRGWMVAAGRVEASAQVRSFEFDAYDDFAQSTVPATNGCGTSAANPCSTQPIVLVGTRAANAQNPALTYGFTVQYAWNQSTGDLDRVVNGGAPVHAATEVTNFSWYLQTAGQRQTVIVNMTVVERNYVETQTLQFYPRIG